MNGPILLQSKLMKLDNLEVVSTLYKWGQVISDEEGKFIKRFRPKACVLRNVSDCGHYIRDSVKISEWLIFIEKPR